MHNCYFGELKNEINPVLANSQFFLKVVVVFIFETLGYGIVAPSEGWRPTSKNRGFRCKLPHYNENLTYEQSKWVQRLGLDCV